MQDQEDLNSGLSPAQRELEAALTGLAPAAPSLARDELMFQAGARSCRRSVRIWQSSASALAACLTIAMLLRVQPVSRPIAQVAPIQIAPTSLPELPRGPFTLASLRILALEQGVDALPSAPPPPQGSLDRSETPSLRPRLLNTATGDPT